jgi:hypothetical protein
MDIALNGTIEAVKELFALPRVALWRSIPDIVFEGSLAFFS